MKGLNYKLKESNPYNITQTRFPKINYITYFYIVSQKALICGNNAIMLHR
jgi:hypothetical protein